ncbi:hypothetical protein PBPMD00_0 [Pinkberry virus LS07-2018-MD00]|jgi:hypothetical protein|nr:hypothetical protein PBPMD00_0 [Pinkberry virus LS07-2018-MD00]
MTDANNYIGVILIPVVLAAIKTLLSNEISYWCTLIYCYFNRPFDLDNNPDTHDWCMLYNPGDGTWSPVSLTFHFSIFKGKNGVFVHRYDEKWCLVSVERVGFNRWKHDCFKAHLNRDNLPSGLYNKIIRSKEIYL